MIFGLVGSVFLYVLGGFSVLWALVSVMISGLERLVDCCLWIWGFCLGDFWFPFRVAYVA